MTFVLTVGQQKGGVGKSTVAVNLAHQLHQQGVSVTLVDADPQGSAMSWAAPQKLGIPVRQELLVLRNTSVWIRNVLKSGSDLIVVDLPAGFGPTFDTAMLISDVVAVPCGPSSLDVGSVRQTLAKAKEVLRVDPTAKTKFVLVPTRVDVTTEEGQQLRDELSDISSIVSPALSYNMGYVRSYADGIAASTFATHSPAADEVKELARFFLTLMPKIARTAEQPFFAGPGLPRR